LIFIAIFIVKIDENCYDLLVFQRFSAAVPWKNVVTAFVVISYDLLLKILRLMIDKVNWNKTVMIIIFKAIFVQLLYSVGKYGFSYCHVLIVLNN